MPTPRVMPATSAAKPTRKPAVECVTGPGSTANATEGAANTQGALGNTISRKRMCRALAGTLSLRPPFAAPIVSGTAGTSPSATAITTRCGR